MKKLLQLVFLLVLSTVVGRAQTYVYPALSTNNTFTGTNTYSNTVTQNGSAIFNSTETHNGVVTFASGGSSIFGGPETHNGVATFVGTPVFNATTFNGTETHAGVETHNGAATFTNSIFTNNVTSTTTITAFPNLYTTPNSHNAFLNTLTNGQDSALGEATVSNARYQADMFTPGLNYEHLDTLHSQSTGDTIWALMESLNRGNSANQNEGNECCHWRLLESPNIVAGTITSITSGPTYTFKLNQTQGFVSTPAGYPGWGSKLYLTDQSNAITAGYVTNWSGLEFTTLTGSGTAWSTPNGTSAITTTTSSIGGVTATVNGTVTISNATGFATSATNLVCLFDPLGGDFSQWCGHLTLSGTTATIDYIPAGYVFPSGSTISQGGLAGWGFSYDWDSICATVVSTCPGGLNGFFAPPDNSLVGIVRKVYPVIGNTSSTSMQIYGMITSRTPTSGGNSSTGAYHLVPMVQVYDAYNHSTNELDGSAIATSAPNAGMTFNTSDTIEQPNYFSNRINGINMMLWRVNDSAANSIGGYLYGGIGGNFQRADAMGTLFNYNDPCQYQGLPSGVQTILCGGAYGATQGTMSPPYGFKLIGSFGNIFSSSQPTTLIGYTGQCQGFIFDGCGMTTAEALAWTTQAIEWGGTNGLGTGSNGIGEDTITHALNTGSISINAGATGSRGYGATSFTFAATGATFPLLTTVNNLTVNGSFTCSGCFTGYYTTNQSTSQLLQLNSTAATANYISFNAVGGTPNVGFTSNISSNSWAVGTVVMDNAHNWEFDQCANATTAGNFASCTFQFLFGVNATNLAGGYAYGIYFPNLTGSNYNFHLPNCTSACNGLGVTQSPVNAADIVAIGSNGQGTDTSIQYTNILKSLAYCGTTTSCSNTTTTGPHIVEGSAPLTAGSATVTGLPSFTSTSSFSCMSADTTSALFSKVVPASTTSITLTGTGTDTISYVCVGY